MHGMVWVCMVVCIALYVWWEEEEGANGWLAGCEYRWLVPVYPSGRHLTPFFFVYCAVC
jgi:hypothetical protein